MGCDMHGAIEGARYGRWEYLVDLDPLIARDYPLYGCLFGVRNMLDFRPVADGRGQPADATRRVRTRLRSWEPDAHSVTWITWGEIKMIDFHEPAERLTSSRPFVYRRLPDGSEVYLYQGDFPDEFPRLKHDSRVYQYWTPDGKPWAEGAEWTSPDGDIYRYIPPRRRHVLKRRWWRTICRLCKVLESSYEPDSIRLVVWFDN